MTPRTDRSGNRIVSERRFMPSQTDLPLPGAELSPEEPAQPENKRLCSKVATASKNKTHENQ